MRSIKIILLSGMFLATTSVGANPFFGENYENQFGFHVGAGVNNGFLIPPPSQFVPFSMLHVQYSQPTTFFKLPARRSLNVVQTIGFGKKYGWEWNKFSIPIAVISGDIALVHTARWYFGPGIGIGMQAKENDRISSKMLFSFKLIGGYKISDQVRMELFVQHFSNGCTTEDNHSYGFYGLGLTYSF